MAHWRIIAVFWLPCCCYAWLAAGDAARANGPGLGLPPRLQGGLAYNELEAAMFQRAEDGRLENDALLTAALIAGGADRDEIEACQSRVNRWADRLRARLDRARDDRGRLNRAKAVFAFLHAEVLSGGYDLLASRIDAVMEEGRFNCVSATILFNVLAAAVGLDVCGGECPAHVVAVLKTGDGPLEIETTCASWFEPPEPRHDAARGRRNDAPKIQRELSPAQMVALVYYNLGVDLAEQRRYEEAIASNYKALRLDPANAAARGNLLAAINNWALDAAEAGDFASALELLADGRRAAPQHVIFSSNYGALLHRWANRLCRQGRHARAMMLVDQARRRFPQDALVISALEAVTSSRAAADKRAHAAESSCIRPSSSSAAWRSDSIKAKKSLP